MIDATIRPIQDGDWPAAAAIFNHYVEHSMAAYPDRKLDVASFRTMLGGTAEYPFLVAEREGAVVGFGYLRPFRPLATMRRTGVLAYFLHPSHTGGGLGGRIFDRLVEEGRRLGVRNFMANISSHNDGSLRFHLRRGFGECGRFREIGEKNGRLYDMIWVQRLEA